MAIKNVVTLGFYDINFVVTLGFTSGAATTAPVKILHCVARYDPVVRLGCAMPTPILLSARYDPTIELEASLDAP